MKQLNLVDISVSSPTNIGSLIPISHGFSHQADNFMGDANFFTYKQGLVEDINESELRIFDKV